MPLKITDRKQIKLYVSLSKLSFGKGANGRRKERKEEGDPIFHTTYEVGVFLFSTHFFDGSKKTPTSEGLKLGKGQ